MRVLLTGSSGYLRGVFARHLGEMPEDMKERGVLGSADAGRTTVRGDVSGVRGGWVLDLTVRQLGNYGR